MTDPVDEIAPWTIKAVATRTRQKVMTAAKREGLTAGQWLEKRVEEWEADGGPVPAGPARPAGDPVALLNAAAAYMQGAAAARVAGLKVSGRALSQAQAAAEAELRAHRGLPAVTPRKPVLAIEGNG